MSHLRPFATWAATALAALLASGAQPAAAAFGDCSDAAWRGSIDPRLVDIAYDCVEAFRVPVSTAEGERWIRVVHDREADWILSPDLLAEVERGIRGAATAVTRLGSFRLSDVTLLLADDLPPGVGVDGAIPAEGEIAAQATLDRRDECIVVLYLLGLGARPVYTATTVAHEIFHCVQAASLDPAQLATSGRGGGSGGDWWIEGSAEWFTALALPDPGPLPSRAAAFDALSPTTPLNALAYGAAIFFLWLGEAEGPAAVLPFLAGMARDPGQAAQWSAMAAALPAERWLAFAEAYRDGRIHHPHGTALALAPHPGETWPVDRTRTIRLAATPFTLLRGTLQVACGHWAPVAQPPEVQVGQRPAEEGDWAPLPAELVVPEGEARDHLVVAINTATGRRPLALRVERRATCQPCAGSREIDACLVGAWQQTGGGPVEWLRANLPPEVTLPSVAQSEAIFVLREDGSYVALPLTIEATMLLRREDGTAVAESSGMAQGAGGWSIIDGRLHLCQESGGLFGSMTMTAPDGTSATTGIAEPGAGILAMDYACSATALSTSLELADDLPPMTTTYGRIGD